MIGFVVAIVIDPGRAITITTTKTIIDFMVAVVVGGGGVAEEEVVVEATAAVTIGQAAVLRLFRSPFLCYIVLGSASRNGCVPPKSGATRGISGTRLA